MIRREDAQAMVEYIDEDCNHWDHHDYCQTHALGDPVQLDPKRCAMGRLLAELKVIVSRPEPTSDKEVSELDPKVPHDTWPWCVVHELPMVHYDPGGPPFCWYGYVGDDVGSCEDEESIKVHIAEGFPRHISYRWVDEKFDLAAAYDALARVVSPHTIIDVGFSGIAVVVYGGYGLLDD